MKYITIIAMQDGEKFASFCDSTFANCRVATAEEVAILESNTPHYIDEHNHLVVDKVRTAKQRIATLAKQLQQTDYKAIKYAEGLISEIDYESIKLARQAIRDRIRQLEAVL